MSITQTFYLAHKARAKLSSEAARSDHNLRLLVGHANLLDSLMLNLQAAEREQDAWFNAMVRGNSMDDEELEDAMDTITEEEEENFGSLAQDYPESDSSDDDEEDEADYEYPSVFPPRPTGFDYARKTTIDEIEVDEEEFEEEDDGFYALRRTSSHVPLSPPELVDDDFSDIESNPPSPPQPTLATPIFYTEKAGKINSSPPFYDSHVATDLMDTHQFYQTANMIPAY